MVADKCSAAVKMFFKERRGGSILVMVSFDDSFLQYKYQHRDIE